MFVYAQKQKTVKEVYYEPTPVRIYSNADTDKLQIVEENRNKAGIYRWVNKINNKTYIGSSITLSDRLLDYYQMSQLMRERRPIDLALLKYGYSNFRLEILEYCEKKETLSREQYYFDLFVPEYNILKVAGSTLGFKHSQETLNHMRTHHLVDAQIRKNRSLARLGVKASEETLETICCYYGTHRYTSYS